MAMYTWGANSHGQLGLGFESELCMSPQKISRTPFNVNGIRSIKGGGGHVLVLDNCGQLYTCGWNNRGQLGMDCQLDHKSEFNRIPNEYFDDATVDVMACGWDISGVITSDKVIFVWGANNFQQLGICQRGFNAVRRPLRLQLPRDEVAKKISFGLRHLAILTEDNKIYIFGRLRVNDPHPELKVSLIPFGRSEIIKIQTNLKIDSLISGQNHLLILLEGRKRIIGLGENKYGQANSLEFPYEIRHLSAGWTHNGVLTKSKEIHLWGRNSYGQIGNSLQDCFRTPTKLQLPEDVIPEELHLGSEHGLLVSSKGKVLAWGWNEHGNCGNASTDNLYSPTLIELPSPCKLAGTGAGFCYAICEAI